jgi:hypothetical protein
VLPSSSATGALRWNISSTSLSSSSSSSETEERKHSSYSAGKVSSLVVLTSIVGISTGKKERVFRDKRGAWESLSEAASEKTGF